MLARHALRRTWAGHLALVLVLTAGLGAALTAIEAADRTSTAYEAHLADAEVADVVVNPVLANARTLEVIESSPGVRRVVSDSLVVAGPTGLSDEEAAFLQVRVSQDGRYI